MTRFQISAVVVMALILLGFFVAKQVVVKHAVSAQLTNVYYVDVEYSKVKDIFMKTDALKEIVSRQHGALIDRKGDSLTLSFGQSLRDWEAVGTGKFTVATQDPEAGELILYFNQKYRVSKTELNVVATLAKPCKSITNLETKLLVYAEGPKTKIVQSAEIRYERYLPRRFIPYMNEKVNESPAKILAKGEVAVRALIDEYKDRRIIIPIKPKQ